MKGKKNSSLSNQVHNSPFNLLQKSLPKAEIRWLKDDQSISGLIEDLDQDDVITDDEDPDEVNHKTRNHSDQPKIRILSGK